ncbi:MAG TPA: bifunctional pyr operon transcriptional regulator/uracil phosphoribosyltransferase PyrR [Noviherbaspirillum sp.]
MPTPDFDAEALYRTLAGQVTVALSGASKIAVVGIYSGGAWIAERLAAELNVQSIGYIDVSFYRDDFAEKGLPAEVKPTHIPFDVEGATVLLVDDVLYTGRTTRAAINELFDYGRPARVMLAALIDRGGRELPVAADFVAERINLDQDQRLVLQRAEDGRFSLTVEHA